MHRYLADPGLFQSSPAPKGRCYTKPSDRRAVHHPVSILTGPEGPVLHKTFRPAGRSSPGFNPHRPRRAGATVPGPRQAAASSRFNPHRPRRAGATRCCIPASILRLGFNPHRPRRAGATAQRRQQAARWQVSILTGPEGPVLQRNRLCRCFPRCFNPHRPRRAGATVGGTLAYSDTEWVSILTDPEGPVLPDQLTQGDVDFFTFQSSPTPKGRCYRHRPQRYCSVVHLFQSSPTPKGRCYTSVTFSNLP